VLSCSRRGRGMLDAPPALAISEADQFVMCAFQLRVTAVSAKERWPTVNAAKRSTHGDKPPTTSREANPTPLRGNDWLPMANPTKHPTTTAGDTQQLRGMALGRDRQPYAEAAGHPTRNGDKTNRAKYLLPDIGSSQPNPGHRIAGRGTGKSWLTLLGCGQPGERGVSTTWRRI
jgi:hypothetical protein